MNWSYAAWVALVVIGVALNVDAVIMWFGAVVATARDQKWDGTVLLRWTALTAAVDVALVVLGGRS